MVWFKRSVLAVLVLMVGVAVWLWLTMLSPWFYERPAHLAPVEQRTHQVFVYGTLRFAPVRWVVMHAGGDPQDDTLEGFYRDGLDIAPAPQNDVPGLMLTVTPEELSRLDRYERLGVRYRREELLLESGELAWVYRRLLEADGGEESALLRYTHPAANDATYTTVKTLSFKETP